MAARNKIYDLKPEQLGFQVLVQHGQMNIYDHLHPGFSHFSLRLKKIKITTDISTAGQKTTTFVFESPMTRVL